MSVNIYVLIRYVLKEKGIEVDNNKRYDKKISRNSAISIQTISNIEHEDYNTGIKNSTSGMSTICEVLLKKKVNKDLVSFFKDIEAGKIVTLDIVGEIEYSVDHEGRQIANPEVTELSAEYQQFSDTVSREARAIAKKYIGILQWLHNAYGWTECVKSTHDRVWSFDKIYWHTLPALFSHKIRVGYPNGFAPTSEIVSNLGETEESIPVYREMLSEGMVKEPTRASFVSLVSALEVAVKVFIAKKLAKANWIVMNAPTPPVDRILKEYIVEFIRNSNYQSNSKFEFSQAIITSVKEAANIRNEIVHKNSVLPSSKTIAKTKSVVNDLICFLEYHSGYEWASYFISNENRKDLGFEIMIPGDLDEKMTKMLAPFMKGKFSMHVRRKVYSNLTDIID